MVAEARLGARESLARGSTYQALQLAETGLTEAARRPRPAVAGGPGRVAGRAARRRRRPRRPVAGLPGGRRRQRGGGGAGLRMRIAYEPGDLEAMAVHRRADRHRSTGCPTTRPGRAMAAVAQSYMLRDQVEPTCEWADKAQPWPRRTASTDVRLPAMVEKGSMLLMDHATTRGVAPAGGGGRRGRAAGRPPAGRPGAQQPRRTPAGGATSTRCRL